MSGPADASLHEPDSGTCGISPTNNDCRKAEPGGNAAQSQHPRRSTDRPACERRQSHGRRHRTARVWTRISSTIPFYGWFGTEARISFALASRRIKRRSPPRVWVRAIWRERPSARPDWESSLGGPCLLVVWGLTPVSQPRPKPTIRPVAVLSGAPGVIRGEGGGASRAFCH
jgi:hypothetical protein